MLSFRSFAQIFVGGLLAVGCTAAAPKQVENAAALPPPAADGNYSVQFPDPGHYAGRSQRLATGPAEPIQCRFSPHFAFGNAEPLPQDVIELRGFAACLKSDAARDKPIEIIGHADVRGSSSRNMRLAQARAERVRDILVEQGVERERMFIRSVGELGALGFLTAYSYGFDRRVDVALIYEHREPSDTNRYDVTAWRD